MSQSSVNWLSGSSVYCQTVFGGGSANSCNWGADASSISKVKRSEQGAFINGTWLQPMGISTPYLSNCRTKTAKPAKSCPSFVLKKMLALWKLCDESERKSASENFDR